MPSMQKRIAIVTVLVIAAVATFIFMQPDPGPCRKIRAICEAQGFKRGRNPAERRNFQENCFRPLLEGQTVGDKKADEDVAAACRERYGRRRERRGNRQNNENSSGDREEETRANEATSTVASLVNFRKR